MKRTIMLIAMLILSLAFFAQNTLKEQLFPPEMVMKHKQVLNLTAEQEEFIKQQYNQAQTKYNNLKWELADARKVLRDDLAQSEINVAETKPKLEKLLGLERSIKLLQFDLFVKIKNQLTAEQQQKLEEIRRAKAERQVRKRSQRSQRPVRSTRPQQPEKENQSE